MTMWDWPLKDTQPRIARRFWRKVRKDGAVQPHVPELGPCWEWTGAVRDPKAGYGAFHWLDGPEYSHRAAWMLEVGPIPDGQWVLHKCDNQSCVRPEHLFLGTVQDNVSDCHKKGRNPRWPK
jgi:hypothetical protein